MKILILTSGGDAPGMNMVIGALYKKYKGKLYGCRAGFKGLINNDIVSIKEYSPLKYIAEAGSVIKCSRCDAFKQEEHFKKAVEYAKRFDSVVVIGGNGSLKGAEELVKQGINVIFIPATIDNDIEGSDYSLGFHTAVKAGCDTFRSIMPSFDAHERVAIIEVMGNKSENLAKSVAKICNPTFVFTSLDEIDYKEIANTISLNKEKGEPSSIIIKEHMIDINEFAEKISDNLNNIEVRGIKVGYIQRGYKPTNRELHLAKSFAKGAIQGIKNKLSAKVFFKNGKIILEKFA